jgi:hypothetical protein
MGRFKLVRLLPWCIGSIALLAVTVLAPFIMKWWAPGGLKWGQLSDISQTYGVVSIPLSGAALIGVVWSIVLQSRQLRISSEAEWRSSYRDLTLRVLEDPSLRLCWEPPAEPVTLERMRQDAYMNAIFNSWRADHANGTMSAEGVLYYAQLVMGGEIAREFWRNHVHNWASGAETMGHRDRRFVELVSKALRQADAAGPPARPSAYFLRGTRDD